MNKIYTSLILVFALIVMWTVYLTNVRGEKNITVRYYTIEELAVKEISVPSVKVGGLIKPNSIKINDQDQLEVSFYVYQGSDSLKVYYYGIRPDLFKDDAEVVVAGAFEDNLIVATELQTKCASRYEGDLKNIEKI
jgi:cytochrome c-type biogenesis protein CcmE|tara:strand:+ start:2516 stop:2923 length:408 start_codon:yes stop_codon:yes gene_type:complete